ncbi:MAG: VWA domain-containing protein [Opitutaceae bacterium]|nr:VWA domain-containing protein [Opitutaceae bacterium]
MTFGAPEWLFLFPALIIAGWRWRGLRLHEPLRAAGLVTLIMALADPRLRLASAGLDLWVLADRSDSTAAAMASQSREIEAILERSRGRHDRIFHVDFAGEAGRRDRGDPVFEGMSSQTRTGLALEYTLGELAVGRAARVLVVTDGYATEPLGGTAEKILRSRVPLDFRLLTQSIAGDWRVAGLAVPPRVLAGESFLVEFTVAGQGDADVPWEVVRGGRVAASGTAAVRGGIGRVRLTDRLGGGGAMRYEARINPPADAHPENNVAAGWVEVASGPRIVLVTNYPDDPLASLLGAQGLAVELVTEPGGLGAARLSGARAVVLNNVAAHRLPRDFMAGLDYFVREQGGGLLMVGGENSFGAGGYFSSPVDALLPVSLELKKEQRKIATALAIAMDRSGSMSMGAGAGLTKMDLANSGAARAVELLGDLDAVSVHAVDTEPHEVVALAQVGPNRNQITETVRRVVSSGGGIVLHQALRAALKELKKAKTGTRHLILFADANDSRQQLNDYLDAVDELRAADATVSVIGMGTETDRDAEILKEVAQRGGGRMFFSADATELPAIFAQETVSIARSAFIKEPTGTQGLPGWSEIAARAPSWLPAVDGYNLSYLKEGATVSLATTDDYTAPLVATWQRGVGRVAAVSFPLGGEFSERIRAWAGYGDFVQTLSRWLAGDDVPPGIALRAEIEGERLTMELLYDENWNARVAQTPPVASLAESSGTSSAVTVHPLVWEKIEPGHFRGSAELAVGRMARGAVRIGSVALPFGPVAVAGSAEWSFDSARLAELRQLSVRSGGEERLDLAQVWRAPRPVSWRSIRAWALGFWAVVFVADAALTGLGISLLPSRKRALPAAL